MRILSFLALFTCLACVRADEPAQPETVANPIAERFKTQIYARNVWDMKVFDGRLYVGTGNSSNEGPHSNAGPVPIFSMSLKTGEWTKDFSVDDEQIDVFRVLDGKLTIPGHDPREDWSKGNFYQLGANGWTKTRTIPNGIHNYDMAFFDGRIWAALGTQGDFQLASSNDGGRNWKTYSMTTGRTYTLCPFENVLLGWGMIPMSKTAGEIAAIKDEKQRGEAQKFLQWAVYEVAQGETITPRPDLTRAKLFPVAPEDSWAKLVRPIEFRKQLLYLGGAVHNDHQTDPSGVYAAASLRPDKIQTRRIELGANEKPWDIEVQNDVAYILTSRKIAGETAEAKTADTFEISVWQSADAKTWTRALHFSQPTFARAFVRDGNDWYFGLGTDVGPGWENDGMNSYTRDLRGEAGTILRVRAK